MTYFIARNRRRSILTNWPLRTEADIIMAYRLATDRLIASQRPHDYWPHNRSMRNIAEARLLLALKDGL